MQRAFILRRAMATLAFTAAVLILSGAPVLAWELYTLYPVWRGGW